MGCFEGKPSEQHQPTAVRGCTDIFWLVVYILFWIALVSNNISIPNTSTVHCIIRSPAKGVIKEYLISAQIPSMLAIFNHTRESKLG